jgi:hypothetical protein
MTKVGFFHEPKNLVAKIQNDCTSGFMVKNHAKMTILSSNYVTVTSGPPRFVCHIAMVFGVYTMPHGTFLLTQMDPQNAKST